MRLDAYPRTQIYGLITVRLGWISFANVDHQAQILYVAVDFSLGGRIRGRIDRSKCGT